MFLIFSVFSCHLLFLSNVSFIFPLSAFFVRVKAEKTKERFRLAARQKPGSGP